MTKEDKFEWGIVFLISVLVCIFATCGVYFLINWVIISFLIPMIIVLIIRRIKSHTHSQAYRSLSAEETVEWFRHYNDVSELFRVLDGNYSILDKTKAVAEFTLKRKTPVKRFTVREAIISASELICVSAENFSDRPIIKIFADYMNSPGVSHCSDYFGKIKELDRSSNFIKIRLFDGNETSVRVDRIRYLDIYSEEANEQITTQVENYLIKTLLK